MDQHYLHGGTYYMTVLMAFLPFREHADGRCRGLDRIGGSIGKVSLSRPSSLGARRRRAPGW